MSAIGKEKKVEIRRKKENYDKPTGRPSLCICIIAFSNVKNTPSWFCIYRTVSVLPEI